MACSHLHASQERSVMTRSRLSARSGGLREFADLDPPHGRATLEIAPGELLRIFGLELAVERLRIVIVHKNEGALDRQLVDELEDLLVALGRRKLAHIDDRCVVAGCGHAQTSPLVARGS